MLSEIILLKRENVGVFKWSNSKRGWLPLQRLNEIPFCAGLLMLTLVVALSGCYYDVQEELVLQTNCDTANVMFQKDVVPILESNCYTCHSINASLGGVTLEGYDNVSTVAQDGRLYGAINHLSGFSPMPKDAAQLDECNLAKINKWISNGALNN